MLVGGYCRWQKKVAVSGSLREASTNQGTEAVTHVHTPPLQLHTHPTHIHTHTRTLTHTRGLHRASACMLGERTPDYATAVTELLCRSATGGRGHVRSNVGHLLHKAPWRCACKHSWSVRPGVCWTNPLPALSAWPLELLRVRCAC